MTESTWALPPPSRPSDTVVIPWKRKARASRPWSASSSACECMSMNPGATSSPPTSTVSSAVTRAVPASPTNAIRSPSTATSAAVAGPPLPSSTVPPVRSRSAGPGAPHAARKAAKAMDAPAHRECRSTKSPPRVEATGIAAAAEERIAAPCAVEARLVFAVGLGVEEGDLDRGRRIPDVQYPQARLVVGLVHQRPVHEEVVVRGGGRSDVLPDDQGVVQVAHVPDQGPGRREELEFVQLVVQVEVFVAFVQPGLVRVRSVRIARDRYLERTALVGHVGDAERVLVGPEADFAPGVLDVGAAVDDAQRVVRVARLLDAGGGIGEAPCEGGARGRAHVDHVKTAAARLAAAVRAHHVGEAGGLVDRDVVRARDAVVQRRFAKGGGRIVHVAQLSQIQDLHPVRARQVGHDERMVPVHLDVAPAAGMGAGCQRQHAGQNGVGRIRQAHEGRPRGVAHQRPLGACLRVGPAPQIAELALVTGDRVEVHAQILRGQPRQQIDVATGVRAREAPRAGGQRHQVVQGLVGSSLHAAVKSASAHATVEPRTAGLSRFWVPQVDHQPGLAVHLHQAVANVAPEAEQPAHPVALVARLHRAGQRREVGAALPVVHQGRAAVVGSGAVEVDGKAGRRVRGRIRAVAAAAVGRGQDAVAGQRRARTRRSRGRTRASARLWTAVRRATSLSGSASREITLVVHGTLSATSDGSSSP